MSKPGEDREHQPPGRRPCVDVDAGQALEALAMLGEIVDGFDQVREVTPKPIEPPHHKDVIFAQRLEAGSQAGPVILAAAALSS